MKNRIALFLCAFALVCAAPAQDSRVASIVDAANALASDLSVATAQRDQAIADRDQATQQLAGAVADRNAIKATLDSLNLRSSSSLAILPTLFDDVQARADWKNAGNTGDSGGGSSKASGLFTVTPGAVARFTAAGNYPYNNGYFFTNVAGANANTRYVQQTQFRFETAADLAASMGVETNFEHSTGTARFNGGLQALFGSDKDPDSGKIVTRVWRWYDIGRNCWRTLGEVPFDVAAFAPGKTVDVVQEFERQADGMVFTAVSINGTRYVINRKSAAKASAWSPFLQFGFQLDSKSTPTPYAVTVPKMRVFAL